MSCAICSSSLCPDLVYLSAPPVQLQVRACAILTISSPSLSAHLDLRPQPALDPDINSRYAPPFIQRRRTMPPTFDFPRNVTFAVVRMDPVAMVRHLDDPEALRAAQAVSPRSYVVFLHRVRSLARSCHSKALEDLTRTVTVQPPPHRNHTTMARFRHLPHRTVPASPARGRMHNSRDVYPHLPQQQPPDGPCPSAHTTCLPLRQLLLLVRTEDEDSRLPAPGRVQMG